MASAIDLSMVKNLARQRALEFGRSDVIHGLDSSMSNEIGTEMTSSSSTVVVRSTATEAEVTNEESSPNDQLHSKPRGFFADQFEVSHLKLSKEIN